MATSKEVARRAGVSIGTVSNVLSGNVAVSPDLRERVAAAIRDLDYHPNHVARSLKVKNTKTLGMVISDITNPFFPLLVRGAEDAAFAHGYLLITFNTDDRVERERQVLSLLRSRRVDGLLLVVAPNDGDIEHIRSTVEAGIPIVCLDRILPGIALDSVSVDNVKGSRMCVHHMILRGHRHIAIITGSLGLQTAKDRLRGYELALRDAGFKVEPDLVCEGDFREQTGYKLGKNLLLSRKRPTAIFVSNGMMTLGVLQALEEIGLKCPDDVAIATFDDLPVSEVFRPHLTSVAQPTYQIGHAGANLLIERLQGKQSSRKRINLVLEPDLRIRESSGRPPQPTAVRVKSTRLHN